MGAESESEKVIRSLYQITNDYQKGFDIQVSQLIMMGLERFDLDIGIFVSHRRATNILCFTV